MLVASVWLLRNWNCCCCVVVAFSHLSFYVVCCICLSYHTIPDHVAVQDKGNALTEDEDHPRDNVRRVKVKVAATDDGNARAQGKEERPPKLQAQARDMYFRATVSFLAFVKALDYI